MELNDNNTKAGGGVDGFNQARHQRRKVEPMLPTLPEDGGTRSGWARDAACDGMPTGKGASGAKNRNDDRLPDGPGHETYSVAPRGQTGDADVAANHTPNSCSELAFALAFGTSSMPTCFQLPSLWRKGCP